MYESVVIVWKGVKYILNYNTNALSPEMIPRIAKERCEDDIDCLIEILCVDFDSSLEEYKEINLD